MSVSRVNIVLLGNAGSGKTSLINRFVKNKFDTRTIPTSAITRAQKLVASTEFTILEVPEEDASSAYVGNLVGKADAVFICYDVHNQASFDAVADLIIFAKTHATKKTYIALIGNKADGLTQQVIATEDGKQLAQDLSCNFYEASARRNNKVEDPFFNAANYLVALSKAPTPLVPPVVDDEATFKIVPKKSSFMQNPMKVAVVVATALFLTALILTVTVFCWPAMVALVPAGVAAYISVMTGFSMMASAALAASTVVAVASAIIVTGLSYLAAKLVDIFGKKSKSSVVIEEVDDEDKAIAKHGTVSRLLSKLGPSQAPRNDREMKPAVVTPKIDLDDKSEGLSFSQEASITQSFSMSQGS